MPNKVEIITIDGPSGVGKGTLSRLLAQKFNYALLDSGAIYRLAALYVLDHQLPLDDELMLAKKLAQLNIRFSVEADKTKAYLDEVDVSSRIREEQTGMMASKIAKISVVRDALMQCQKNFAEGVSGLVADGRDMGTVVFPLATHKFFLEADSRIRAKRRFDELAVKGEKADYSEILAQLEARDRQDRNRVAAPLRPAEDALIIDTSHLDIMGVFDKVLLAIELKNRQKAIQRWMECYYQLLIKNIEHLGYVPEFLDKPHEIDADCTRLLCQTRGMFYLLTYARLTNTTEGLNKAYQLYQMIKNEYFDSVSQGWYKDKLCKNDNDPYEYAFLLFSLSELYGSFKEKVLLKDILNVHARIHQKFIENEFSRLRSETGVMGQNPLMHLFEAYLMAFRHSRETLFKAQAEDLYRKIMALFFDPQKKLIREYSIEKQPEIFEPGHSFEWCCLIAEAKALGVDVSVMDDDKTLSEQTLKQGLSAKGYVRPNLHESEQTSPYRIWPMLEYMRYLAMSGQSASLASVFDTFSAVFIDHDLPVEYVDYSGHPGFNLIKSTTGYHLINCWQYML